MTHPAIAIITPDTLACLGLADLIHRMMPGAGICTFPRYVELARHAAHDAFFHYFVSADELLPGAAFFLQHRHKTIVLTRGEEANHLPQGFHTLNVCLSEKDLVRSMVSLAHRSHHVRGDAPEAVKKAQDPAPENDRPAPPRLTPREREVLKGVVKGLINKEIAAQMGVGVATVITHRKNLTEKIGTHSVAALTIYALAHNIVRTEDI